MRRKKQRSIVSFWRYRFDSSWYLFSVLSSTNNWLPVFVLEARLQDGSNYSPNSLYQLMCGILHKWEKSIVCVTIAGTLKILATNSFSPHYTFVWNSYIRWDLEILWSRLICYQQLMSSDFVNAKNFEKWCTIFIEYWFFYNCKLFGLRAMDERRSLLAEQFLLGIDSCGTFKISWAVTKVS